MNYTTEIKVKQNQFKETIPEATKANDGVTKTTNSFTKKRRYWSASIQQKIKKKEKKRKR